MARPLPPGAYKLEILRSEWDSKQSNWVWICDVAEGSYSGWFREQAQGYLKLPVPFEEVGTFIDILSDGGNDMGSIGPISHSVDFGVDINPNVCVGMTFCAGIGITVVDNKTKKARHELSMRNTVDCVFSVEVDDNDKYVVKIILPVR